MVPTHKSVLALDVSCTAQSLNERYGILIPESMRKPNSPAPHPDTDIRLDPAAPKRHLYGRPYVRNRYAKVGSHLAAQIARYKVGAEFR